MSSHNSKMKINFGTLHHKKYGKKGQSNHSSRDSTPQMNTAGGDNRPPLVVETVISGSQSQTSSIGIGEYGMNPARRGNAAAFAMAVKDNLFPKLKFLQGTNASLDFSMDNTSICGFLRLCCGVPEADAYQWWEDHRILVKHIHTDCQNNKIKMLKQQFNGKYILIVNMCLTQDTTTQLTTLSTSLA
jgi:hypothetical protein